jgi:hypothetical protein
MLSAVIAPTKNQLTLDFNPGLLDRHLSLRDCVAAGVYQRGLGRVAIDLNQAPGNLSVQLSEDPTRHFSVDSLERYIEKTGDTTPVLYLVERFLAPEAKPKNAKQVQAIQDAVAALQQQLSQLVAA